MTANELEIGDLVYNHRNWECPIVEIHKNSAVVIARHYGEEEFLLSDLRPIPLTPEILEKNGWKDISDHTLKGCETFKLHYEQNAFDYYITIKLRDYFKLESYDDRFYTLCEMEFGCRYVHQLQHALKLCGIDKEIIL